MTQFSKSPQTRSSLEKRATCLGMSDYEALKTMLLDAGRLFPEERRELVQLLGRAERLEAVYKDAEAVVHAYLCTGIAGAPTQDAVIRLRGRVHL